MISKLSSYCFVCDDGNDKVDLCEQELKTQLDGIIYHDEFGIVHEENIDQEAKDLLRQAKILRTLAVCEKQKKVFDIQKLESATEKCTEAHEKAHSFLIKSEARYESGLCYNALRWEARAEMKGQEVQGECHFESEAKREFEASNNHPLSIMELGKLFQSKYYELGSVSFLFQAIEKYQEALKVNADLVNVWHKERIDSTKNDICYCLGRAYLDQSFLAQTHLEKYIILECALEQFQQADGALRSFSCSRHSPSFSRKENPTFEDLQAVYVEATALKEIGLLMEDRKQKWKMFIRAINLLKLLLPKTDGHISLHKDVLLLIGACYYLAYIEGRKTNANLLESAANAFKNLYTVDKGKGMSAAIACYNLGNIFYEKINLQDAVTCYQKSLEILEKNSVTDSSFGKTLKYNLFVAKLEMEDDRVSQTLQVFPMTGDGHS
mmetsp:Transcript_18741/g.24745  ORF Transcript_18741/g.24745 Transcript_18741/m.24745 type:complete len:437 (+) Transcript_18741:85-1395(+)